MHIVACFGPLFKMFFYPELSIKWSEFSSETMTMLSTVGEVRWFCYNFVLLDNSWPQRWGAEWRQWGLTSDQTWATGQLLTSVLRLGGPWGHRRILVTPSCIIQCPIIIALLTVTDGDCWPWPDDYWPHMILTWGRYWCILCLCVTSQGGECSVTVYCRSSVSSLQSPAWGQLRARVRSEESLNWSEDRELESSNNSREQERDIVFIKLSILLALHAYHISYNNPIHAEKSVCAKFHCQ